jgi:hypothetical protein
MIGRARFNQSNPTAQRANLAPPSITNRMQSVPEIAPARRRAQLWIPHFAATGDTSLQRLDLRGGTGIIGTPLFRPQRLMPLNVAGWHRNNRTLE